MAALETVTVSAEDLRQLLTEVFSRNVVERRHIECRGSRSMNF